MFRVSTRRHAEAPSPDSTRHLPPAAQRCQRKLSGPARSEVLMSAETFLLNAVLWPSHRSETKPNIVSSGEQTEALGNQRDRTPATRFTSASWRQKIEASLQDNNSSSWLSQKSSFGLQAWRTKPQYLSSRAWRVCLWCVVRGPRLGNRFA